MTRVAHKESNLSQEGSCGGAGEMVQLVKCSLDRYEDLNLTLQPRAKGCVFIAGAWGVETRGSLGLPASHFNQFGDLQVSKSSSFNTVR